MSDTEEDYATKGHPFEKRCEGASKSLRSMQLSLQHFAAEELEYRQRSAKRRAAFLNGLPETARSEMSEFVERLRKAGEITGNEMPEILWKYSIELCEALFGKDATEFALERVKRETNAS